MHLSADLRLVALDEVRRSFRQAGNAADEELGRRRYHLKTSTSKALENEPDSPIAVTRVRTHRGVRHPMRPMRAVPCPFELLHAMRHENSGITRSKLQRLARVEQGGYTRFARVDS